MVESSISLAESAESTETRDELRDLVETVNEDIPYSTKAKHVSITFVELEKAYTMEEIIKMLSLNEFSKSFCIRNKLEDHKIHAVKPLKNKPYK